MNAFFEALDNAEPYAVFWAAVVWVAVTLGMYVIARVQGRRARRAS